MKQNKNNGKLALKKNQNLIKSSLFFKCKELTYLLEINNTLSFSYKLIK